MDDYSLTIDDHRLTLTVHSRQVVIDVPDLYALGIDPKDPKTFHRYVSVDEVGVVEDAPDIDTVWEFLQKEPFPTFGLVKNLTPKRDGDVSAVPFAGEVIHHFNDSGHAVANVSREGHLLHPAYVVRHLFEAEGKYYIVSIGEGNGRLKSLCNYFCNLVWGHNARHIGASAKKQNTAPLLSLESSEEMAAPTNLLS